MDPRKDNVGVQAGHMIVSLLKSGVKPSDILTKEAFENAIAAAAATGGSTNSVLHLLALAREANIPLSMDDFNRVSARTPVIADLTPGGHYVATDMHYAGGTRLVAKNLLAAGLLHGDRPTPSGRTLAEEAAGAEEAPGQKVISTVENAFKPRGGIVILHGNLAPEGAVIKLAGTREDAVFSGPARIFDREEDAMEAVKAQRIQPGDVVIIRYEGPKGGPGMREMLGVTAALVGQGLGGDVALLTDGRFSGCDARPDGRPCRPRSQRRRPHRPAARRRQVGCQQGLLRVDVEELTRRRAVGRPCPALHHGRHGYAASVFPTKSVFVRRANAAPGFTLGIRAPAPHDTRGNRRHGKVSRTLSLHDKDRVEGTHYSASIEVGALRMNKNAGSVFMGQLRI